MALPEWIEVPRRKNPRAKGFDYSTPGMYMITQCIQNRVPLLCRIEDSTPKLTAIGLLVERHLLQTVDRFADTELDCYCIMPDHFHFILSLSLKTGKKGTSVVDFMRVLKSLSTREYNIIRQQYSRLPEQFMQRSFGDEVIEDEEELYAYRKYILENPQAYQLRRDGHL
ncbi:transposase [bacterium]|nr:transposase [bacterium]